jgi:TolB-like protein
MEKRFTGKLIQIAILFFAVFPILLPVKGLCEEQKESSPVSIAVLPFATHAADNLSYLQDGIRAMLSSRLAAGSETSVIDKTLVDTSMAELAMSVDSNLQNDQLLTLARQLGAEYLVAGSLTALGGSMSLDAKVLSVTAPENPQSFFATAAAENDVIAAIDRLARDMKEKLFGSTPAAVPAALPTPAPITEPVTPEVAQGESHPERAFRSSVRTDPSVLTQSSGRSSLTGFTKSQNLDFYLQSMDVGDIDGDGTDDIVVASENQIYVYHRQENNFTQFGSVSLRLRYKIHALSMADLNNNGRDEIYISAADEDTPFSFAVEWQGGEFAFFLEKEPWFIRAVTIPDKGMILAGQPKGSRSPMGSDIYQLLSKTEGSVTGPLKKGERLPIPGGINIFDFVYADIDGDQQLEIAHINQADRLNVLRAEGKMVWQSSSLYGGTTRHIGKSENVEDEHTRNALTPNVMEKIFIPCRLIAADLNQDGLMDVVVNRNGLKWSPVFKNLKSYNSGQMVGLTWNGVNLTELWQTRQVDGYITGYQLRVSPDKNGEAVLYVGLNLLGVKESAVLLYTLDFTKTEE